MDLSKKALKIMNSSDTQTLILLDLARAGITLQALNDTDPALVEFGLQHQLIHVLPGPPPMVHLTGAALERSLALRDEGNPIFGIDIHPHGLSLRTDLTQEQWFTTLQRLRILSSAYHNILADVISYGRAHFDTTFVDQSIEQLEFSFEDINHAISIAHVSTRLRIAFPLTSEHYYVLGLKFPTDHASQELWADRARQHKLSAHNLKRSIEDGRILTDTALRQLSGHNSGLPILQGIALPFSRWVTTVGGLKSVSAWDPERRAQVLQEISPIVEFALRLRQTLETTQE